MFIDYLHSIKLLTLFYKKLLIPSLGISLAIGLLNFAISEFFSTTFVATFYPLIALLAQYSLYEIQTPNEYYLYHNLGFSKSKLWVCNLIFSLIISILIVLI